MRLCFIYFLVLFIFEYGNGVIAPSTNSKNGEKDKSGIVHVTSGPIHALPNQQFGKRNKHKIVAEVMPFVSVPLLSISKKKVDKSVESSAVESDESLDSVEESESTFESKEYHPETTTIGPSTTRSASKPMYRLIYFDARGICESIRLLFVYSKVPFSDKRITKKEWLRMKESSDFGRIPILEVNGKQKLSQCLAISRYLAKKFGLDGADEWETAKLDEISEFHREVVNDISPYFYVLGGYRAGNTEQMRKEVFLPIVEKYFPIYVKLLKQSKSGFFGKNISWVDFTIGEFFYTIKTYEPVILKQFPSLVRFLDKLYHLPEIRPYLKQRTKTPL